MLPNFVIAGASKTGSEWLMRCLEEHPDVFVSRDGIEFFSGAWDRGLAWYESTFAGWNGEKAVGEKSTSYIVHPETPARLHACVPDAKVLFVLREPIARAVSHYRMELRAGRVGEAIDEVLVPGHPLVEEGRYATQLDRFEAEIPRAQIHVFLYDDLLADPAGFLRGVLEALQVDPDFQPDILAQRFHVTKSRPRLQWLYNALVKTSAAVSRRSETGRRWIEAARRRGMADWFHRVNRGDPFPELGAESVARLRAYYAADTARLADRLDRDLSAWVS